MGLGGALGIAANAIDVFSTGIQVAGQNIANANTPGYIREQLHVAPGPSYGVSPVILGTGVEAQGVTQQVDQYLQSRVLAANSDYSASQAMSTSYTALQQQLQALGDNDLSASINNFTSAISNLANQPESAPLKQQAVVAGTSLANAISSTRLSLDQQRIAANVNVDQLATQANSLIQQIAQLNPQITKLESSGLLQSQAGSLRDQRYQALNQLSQILPITYHENADGSINVYTGSDYLVLGGETQYQQLNIITSGDQQVPIHNVQLSITGTQITANSKGSGELIGALKGRDQVMGGFVQQLDTLASHLISSFNSIYSSGQGTAGYTSVTSDNSVSSPTAALNNAGLAFTPKTGSFDVKVTNTLTGLTQTTTINIALGGNPSDTTLNSLASSLNGVANLSATVTSDGHLQISADPNYQIQFSNDNSNVLTSLGINTFFTGSDSSNIGVNAAVTANPNLFATGQGGGPSDGSNAIALSNFATQANGGLNGQSVNDYYSSMVSDVANSASAETALASGQKDFRDSLQSQQQQFSGVTLDEEAIAIMQYQQSYQAAAHIVSTVDDLYKVLLQL